MTYAVLDVSRRVITYARAGHTPLIYLPATGQDRSVRVLAPDGLVLGLKIDDGEMFEHLLVEETMPIAEGDLFALFTDGITEAMNAGDDCFGETRLGALIEEHSHLPTEELRERVLREIAAFVGSAPQHDDMTMLLIRIGQPAQTPGPMGEAVPVEARS
jgi:sigma-B regulation protein RsbU (phosphoserine phosphatase)